MDRQVILIIIGLFTTVFQLSAVSLLIAQCVMMTRTRRESRGNSHPIEECISHGEHTIEECINEVMKMIQEDKEREVLRSSTMRLSDQFIPLTERSTVD